MKLNDILFYCVKLNAKKQLYNKSMERKPFSVLGHSYRSGHLFLRNGLEFLRAMKDQIVSFHLLKHNAQCPYVHSVLSLAQLQQPSHGGKFHSCGGTQIKSEENAINVS